MTTIGRKSLASWKKGPVGTKLRTDGRVSRVPVGYSAGVEENWVKEEPY